MADCTQKSLDWINFWLHLDITKLTVLLLCHVRVSEWIHTL